MAWYESLSAATACEDKPDAVRVSLAVLAGSHRRSEVLALRNLGRRPYFADP